MAVSGRITRKDNHLECEGWRSDDWGKTWKSPGGSVLLTSTPNGVQLELTGVVPVTVPAALASYAAVIASRKRGA